MERIVPGRRFSELREGEELNFPCIEAREDMIATFSNLTGDHNLLHVDERFAAESRYGGRILHGMLTASLAIAPLGNETFNGTALALTEASWKFLAPVKIGDLLNMSASVASKEPRKNGEGGKVRFSIEAHNQNGKKVLEGCIAVLIR